MHERYAKDGLVCMSVSVDEMDRRPAALRFLQSRGASFPNYLLNEDITVWQDKLKIAGPPCVFVFDQQGRQVAKFDNNDTEKIPVYERVAAQVRQLLSEVK
jgi:hypothetical protein